MENYYGLIAATLSPFFSSVSTIFKSEAAKTLSPLVVVSFGGIIGSVILFVIAFFRKERISKKLLKENMKDISFLVALRFILGEVIFTYGLVNTSAIKAIFFTKIEPYFVLILGWLLLKEKVKGKDLILLTIHLFGVLLLSTGGFLLIPHAGDLLVILAMFCFASSYIAGKRVSHNLGPTLGNAIPMGIANLILFPLAIFLSSSSIFSYSFKGWEYLFIYVILFNVIALTLWFYSLKMVKGWIVSALRYIGPVLGAPVAYVLFGQTLNLAQIFGAIVIIVTSFLIAKEHFSTKKEAKQVIIAEES